MSRSTLDMTLKGNKSQKSRFHVQVCISMKSPKDKGATLSHLLPTYFRYNIITNTNNTCNNARVSLQKQHNKPTWNLIKFFVLTLWFIRGNGP